MKNIVITGVSKGVGLSLVKILMNDKEIRVYGVSRTMTQELRELISEYSNRLFWRSYDLSDFNNIHTTIFKDWLKLSTPLYGYVNNAAIAYDDLITNLNSIKLTDMYKTNVFGPMFMTKSVIRQMLLHNIKGSIVHVSSISVHTGYKGLAMYASTKGAIEAFSKNTAREWGELGIRSNCLVAGFMETEMSALLSKEQKQRIYQRTALKKPVSIDSVANTIKYLLLNDSSSISGQNIFVDNGTI